MFQYLKGQVISLNKNAQNRWILILEVNHIGYEIQVPASMVDQLELASPNMTQIFTYFQVREDHQALYGFLTQAERELFGQLVSVSGIGTQLAIALLETLGLENLVQAVVTGNINQLAKTPGVGKKTAERLALELKSKLSQWRQGVTTLPSSSLISTEVLEDVEMTLLALGYSQSEINQAIAASPHQWQSQTGQDPQLQQNVTAEEWIRQAITWLSTQ
ncbi:MAG: Holliday junction branch migration protein RuvA [Microcystaceae cyanobacterium]